VPAETFSACAASAFYRMAALDEVGLLDESFVSYYEDVELGFRLQWAGWRCLLARESICYHHLGASYGQQATRMHYHSALNAERVWWRHLTPRMRWRYLPAHVAFLALQLASKIAQAQARPYLAGKLHALRERTESPPTLRRITEHEMLQRLERRWFRLHVGERLRGTRA
jgi:GT2 family glycosyltransferase